MSDKPFTTFEGFADDLADVLGRPHIKRPRAITTPVRQLAGCPRCQNFAHPGAACKRVEAEDNGYTLTRTDPCNP